MYVRTILLQITTWQYWHSLYALQFKESATWFVLFERANKYEMRNSLFWFISYSPSQRNCLQAALLILHMNKMWKHKKIQKPFFVVILIKACIFCQHLAFSSKCHPLPDVMIRHHQYIWLGQIVATPIWLTKSTDFVFFSASHADLVSPKGFTKLTQNNGQSF